jgi:hypothetical protein
MQLKIVTVQTVNKKTGELVPREVQALVNKNLAANPSLGNPSAWVITHVPSGATIVPAKYGLPALGAIRLAEKIERVPDINWKLESPFAQVTDEAQPIIVKAIRELVRLEMESLDEPDGDAEFNPYQTYPRPNGIGIEEKELPLPVVSTTADDEEVPLSIIRKLAVAPRADD